MPLVLTAIAMNIMYSSVKEIPSLRYKLIDFLEEPVPAATGEKEI